MSKMDILKAKIDECNNRRDAIQITKIYRSRRFISMKELVEISDYIDSKDWR